MDFRTNSRWPLLALLAVPTVAIAAPAFRAVRASSEADAAATAQHAYDEKVTAGYKNRYGAAAHFLRSNATADTGEFIDPKNFATAKYWFL